MLPNKIEPAYLAVRRLFSYIIIFDKQKRVAYFLMKALTTNHA